MIVSADRWDPVIPFLYCSMGHETSCSTFADSVSCPQKYYGYAGKFICEYSLPIFTANVHCGMVCC